MGPIHSLSDEDWNKTFSVNTTGVFNMSRAVSKNMMLRKSGQLLQSVQMRQIRREWRWLRTPRQNCNDDVYEMFRTRACGIQYTLQLSFSRFY